MEKTYLNERISVEKDVIFAAERQSKVQVSLCAQLRGMPPKAESVQEGGGHSENKNYGITAF